MTVRGEVKLAEGEAAPVAAPARASTAFGSFRLLQVLILGLTIAGVVIGLRIAVPGGIAPVDSVAFGLTVVWALLGFVDTHARDRTGSKVSPFHLLAGVNALVAVIALAAGRQAETVHASSSARATSRPWPPSWSRASRSTSSWRSPTAGCTTPSVGAPRSSRTSPPWASRPG